MASTTSDPVHKAHMRTAVSLAGLCVPTPTAFCVGCVIVDPSVSSSATPGSDSDSHGGGDRQASVVSTGYSRELPGNTHAEQCALDKLLASPPLPSHLRPNLLDLYTSMEPCSTRLSGNTPCVDRILSSKLFRRIFVGVSEPDDFVACEGNRKLREAGLEVIVVDGFENEALEAARRGHEDKKD